MRLVWLSSVLLLAALSSPVLGQSYNIHGRPRAAGAAALDWSASFVAWWDCEEASGTRVASGGSCSSGSDCDLTDNNTVTQDTTNFVEGSASCDFEQDNAEYLSCADATCDELDNPGASLTYGCWVRPESLDIAGRAMTNLGTTGGGGYYLRHQTGTGTQTHCQYDDGTTGVNDFHASGNVVDTWAHQVCRIDVAGAAEFEVFADAAGSGGPTSISVNVGDDANDFILSSDATNKDFDGQLDECFVIFDVLTDAEICRICSCGIDGSACTCNGTAYTDEGRNDSSDPGCGSCTLPDCNAAAP